MSIVSINPEYKLSIRAIGVLFNYLKNGMSIQLIICISLIDPKVFKRFKPNKAIVKNMNLSSYVLSTNPKDADLAMDFCAFLLRYHRDIDYSDFSDD